MSDFNLVEEPWIPVRTLDGTHRMVSLEALFQAPATLADLDCAPHERISLMRLLVCITQAELGAPASSDGWEDFGHDLETRVPAYLRRPDIFPHFNLFGDGPRFLQVRIPENNEPVDASKLIPHLATGNNSTLLDHEGGTGSRYLTPAQLALALLSFQCFYPLYGAGYKGRGPCVDGNMLHTLILGLNLRETIFSNCLSRDWIDSFFPPHGMGHPIWELPDDPKQAEGLAIRSYLGRLVPRHRDLCLKPDSSGFWLRQKSWEYPRFEEFREPSATVVVITKNDVNKRKLLPARLDKAVWRDLHVMTMLRQSSAEEARAPLVLQVHHARLGQNAQLWTGALVTDLKAKILDTIESTFTVPLQLFQREGQALYHRGVDHAEIVSQKLYGAVKQYGQSLKQEDSAALGTAQRHYWHALEQKVEVLLDLVRQPASMTENFGESSDPWTVAVHQAVLTAYRRACPCQEPRQRKAYATGLKILPALPTKPKLQEATP
ncbi:MAG: type I-E CRISPR-associated protein Cse1/CasA [Terrimicrobiaceae bacterium]